MKLHHPIVRTLIQDPIAKNAPETEKCKRSSSSPDSFEIQAIWITLINSTSALLFKYHKIN